MSKRKLTQILLIVAVVVAGWTGYRERLRVTAWVWHIRHGGVLRFGDYLVPVPANWYVNDYGSGNQILIRLDYAKGNSSNGPRLPASISLMEEPPLKDLTYWESFVTSSFRRNGTETVARRQFNLDGQTLVCVGGNALPAAKAKIPSELSWNCRSSGSLEILIRGQEDDLSQAWDIVSRIRNGGARSVRR